jgi:hypothetical protein
VHAADEVYLDDPGYQHPHLFYNSVNGALENLADALGLSADIDLDDVLNHALAEFEKAIGPEPARYRRHR